MMKNLWTYAIVLSCLAAVPVIAGQGQHRRGRANAAGCVDGGAVNDAASETAAQSTCPAACRRRGPCGRSDRDTTCDRQNGQQRRMRFGNSGAGPTQPRSDSRLRPAGRGKRQATSQGHAGMSQEEHERVQALLANHQRVIRTIEEIPGGVKATTTTDQPELVTTLRTHVREMTNRLRSNQPVRMWDPVFRNVFDNARHIEVSEQDVPNGIEVTETSTNPDVVSIIRTHARSVSGFVDRGITAAAPPWAGVNR